MISELNKKEKIVTSLACPYCNSSNIHSKIVYLKDHDEISSCDDESTVEVYSKRFECHCNSCNKDYKVDYGFDKYVIFNKPINQASCTIDNQLLALYESDSERNYEIIKGEKVDGRYIYFIMYEEDPYPIFISEADIDKLIHSVEEAKGIIFETFMKRHR